MSCRFRRAVAVIRARKGQTTRACQGKSFRQRAEIGCCSPVDPVIAGEEMLVIAARRMARRGY